MTALRTADVVGMSGGTYRQIDYWVRRGLLHPDDMPVDSGGNERPERDAKVPGSGMTRRWSTDEAAVCERMVRLVHGGLTITAAERIARGQQWIGPGIYVVVSA